MKPLQGVTVVEFSTMITAAFSSMMLAEQGARVIKVEPPDIGDPMRYIGTAKGGISSLFANCNRGKESVEIDLKTARGQALAQQLIADADVVIHNYRPGVMDSLNLGSERLRGTNKRLIYVAISGFGLQGSLRNAPAYDSIVQAHAGMTDSQGMGEQTFIRNLMCDKLTAYTTCQAVTTGLYTREKSGMGQHIDISMLDASIAFMFPDAYQNHTLLDEDVVTLPLLTHAIHKLTLTRDGIITIAGATDEQRAGIVKAVNKEHLLEDPRFNSLKALVTNAQEFYAELEKAFLALSTEEALSRLSANDVPSARCHSLKEVLDQEQVHANNTIEIVEHPRMGKMRVVRPPIRFGGEQLPVGSPSPALGEQTEAVLREHGLNDQQLEALKAERVIR